LRALRGYAADGPTEESHRNDARRAKIRVEVKRLLKRYKYPPDRTEAATDLVLEQAEAFASTWAAA
jgi:type I restriction enzyme R subunit